MKRILTSKYGKRVLIALGCGLAVLLVLGLANVIPKDVTVYRATHRASAASATPSESGEVESGTADCRFSANDGTELASIAVTDTANCSAWTAPLAHDGAYWFPVPYSVNGATGVVLCTLQGAGGMTMTVADESSNASDQYTDGIASGICTSEEQNGWTPAAPA
jgi:hypothetical protein